MRMIRSVESKKGKICKPALVVVVAMGNDEPLDTFETMSANLLKQRRTAIDKETAVTDIHKVADTFAHVGKRTIVPQYPDINSFSTQASPRSVNIFGSQTKL